MELEYFIIDAFTSEPFKGNSAAVVPLTDWLSDEQMQHIAAENNLSETAFIQSQGNNHYQIRWFSPLQEIDFCGHATLASAYVLFQHFDVQGKITFSTLNVGELQVTQDSSARIVMSFPNRAPVPVDNIPQSLLDGLSIAPQQVLRSEQAYFAVYDNEQSVLDVVSDSETLKQLAPYDVVVTAAGSEYDFVSRYFWPANGGVEDPVTGSIHAGLAPFWAEQLDQPDLVAYQASQRGGVLYCHIRSDRVIVAGHGVLYAHGSLFVS